MYSDQKDVNISARSDIANEIKNEVRSSLIEPTRSANVAMAFPLTLVVILGAIYMSQKYLISEGQNELLSCSIMTTLGITLAAYIVHIHLVQRKSK